ncbi:AAA ATPase domain-containing protein [Paraburkholderia steynii]|uniref:AAA ATPase domain-containing protein n=1 Tax=Paraburkholderia steynii TaxID=1245441 RepID=A0A7Z7BA33_9BURK|nr:ATP-binding protein [Paraburkholderia steynii]SDI38483.1 AAA ATPase domain-containing protein [Paraburkholderia steynii]
MNPDDSALDPARLFAALSGPFAPKQALQPLASADNVNRLVMAATRLAEVCDTNPVGGSDRWLMRAPARHSLLKSLDSSQLADAIEQRRKSAPDAETADLLAILLDEPPLARADIQAIIDAPSDRAMLERVIVALDRAGDVAPAKDLVQAARSALAEFYRAGNRRRVVERGFFGRENESAQIADWLSRPVDAAPATCLFVTGGPGIGKSTLLAESVRRHYDAHRPLILRLDFDRSGLDVQDQLGLTMEAARQLAEQLGAAGSDLLDARLDAGHVYDFTAKTQLSLRQILPEQLAMELGKTVAASGRLVLVVLDTLEVLRGRGETHPGTLFRWLDTLVFRGVKPMVVLAAGRGDALDSLRQIGTSGFGSAAVGNQPERVKRLELHGLEDNAALALLAGLGAPPDLRHELLELAQGNPLKLRLAAEVARRAGVEHLPKRKRGREVDAAFLYRMLLSRIEDPDLRRLAHPGLIVRRINAELVRKVLAPTLGLGSITEERANELLIQLATHHWLVEQDPGAPGFLKHRSDMRMLLLPLLYRSSPKQSSRIDAAALRWFAALPQPWAQIEAVYHQLQLTRVGRAVSSVPVQIASQFDDETLGELPSAAADLVRLTRGERTSQFRGPQAIPSAAGGGDAGIARELLAVIQRQDWREGAYLVRSVMDTGGLDVRSEAADAIRTFLWRSGQWADARSWLDERDRFNDSDEDLAGLPDSLALARLEMRAEFDPEGMRRRWPAWRQMLHRLEPAAVSATDSCARHGALALLLATSPEPFYFSQTNTRESNPAAAANEHWGGVPGNEAKRAFELGLEKLRRVAPDAMHTGTPLFGLVLATHTPYSIFADNLSVMEGHSELRDTVASSVETISTANALYGDRQLTFVPPESGSQIGALASLGVFAEWVEALAYVRRDDDLKLIGRAAERWRRTMAGDWSIGRRRGEWRRLPSLDETLRERLRDLSDEPNSTYRARNQLDIWARALRADNLIPRLGRRLRGMLSEASRSAAELNALDVVTRRLLARGVPAAFAPPLAVLIVHHEL